MLDEGTEIVETNIHIKWAPTYYITVKIYNVTPEIVTILCYAAEVNSTEWVTKVLQVTVKGRHFLDYVLYE